MISNSKNPIIRNIIFRTLSESDLIKLVMSGKNLKRQKVLAQIQPPSLIASLIGVIFDMQTSTGY
jgi:flagellar basal body-associated protein FliL